MKQSKKTLSILLALILVLNLLPPISIVAADTPSQGLQFALSSSRTSYNVSGIGTCTDTDIVIPSQYNDLPVTGISNSAFSYCSNLTSITIPEGVTSIGIWAFEYCSSLTSITIPESVTSIAESAFFNCSKLRSIAIPEGVTAIDDHTFVQCSSLTDITIPESVTSIGSYAFSHCSSLTGITIPEGVTSIGSNTFWKCSNLASITIPESVTSIGEYAFNDCPKLKDVYYTGIMAQWNKIDNTNIRTLLLNAEIHFSDGPITRTKGLSFNLNSDGTAFTASGIGNCTDTDIVIPSIHNGLPVTGIDNSAFYGCSDLTSVTISAGVTSIGIQAFWDCTSLTSVTIPEGVTNLGFSAFRGCSKLLSVTIPEGVTSIETQTFLDCTSLTSATIPEGVTGIAEYAFKNCTSLTSINIPEGVTNIGLYAFENCSSLTGINISETVTSIDTYALFGCTALTGIEVSPENPNYCSKDGVLFSKDMSSLIHYPVGNSRESYSIPEGVTSICAQAFRDCTNLTDITIPESVTDIGVSAFFGCSNLTGITLPESVTSIEGFAFSNCTGLTSINIPGSMTHIVNSVFKGCSSLTDITIPESVTGIGWDAFRDCSNLTSITIPKELTTIGEAAFYGCSALADVYYSGSKAQWDEIHIGSKNECLQNATIHYTQCDHCYEEETVPATCSEAGSITYTCPLCGDSYTEELPALGHSYADGFCTRCGAEDPEREKQVAEPEEAQFVVGATTGKAGDEITVSLSIANNPGIVSAYLQLYYDTSKLELVSAEDAELLKDATFGSILSNMPYSLNWDDSLSSENNTANGVIANLTFRIKEDCEPGEAAITLHYDPYSVLDTNLEPVSFAISDGAVRVVDYYAGDADGDNLITARDVVVLRRYLAGDHSITLSESAADCDGIPGINARDVAYLRRNLAHWEGYELQYPQ